uniref:F-box domain-containing protein n=1 Tax=Arundo donax TaxID=35708 RepID=A0A0A8YZX5_ARUDO
MTTRDKRRVVASGGGQVLPDEMMTEIFLWLPVKSILRFRAVCRSWAAMLCSEEFCNLHMEKTNTASAPPKLFFTSPTSGFNATAVYLGSSSGPDDGLLFTLSDVRGDFVDMTSAPCRGLTLLYDAVAPAYYVFNAATRAVTRLPPYQNVMFATAGLGFDARTKKYKVVRLFQGNLRDQQRVKCEIYTLGGEHGDCWRPAVGGVPFRFCRAAVSAIGHSIHDKLLPVFADGFLHWLLHPLFILKRPRTAILSFSVTDETFRCVQSPPFVAPGVRFVELDGHLGAIRERLVSSVHLVELAGHLCVVRDLRNASFDCSMLEIWKLNDYNSGGWSLVHRIDLLAHVARDLVEPQIVKVVGSVGNCGSTKKVIIATSTRKVIIYDPVLQTLETILAIKETQSSYQTEQSALRVSLFKENLVPVHQTNEEIALSAPMAKATWEILLRIPGSHTVQLKLVCKQWLRLIENSSFMSSYYLHNNMEKRPSIMLVGKGNRGSGFSFVRLKKLLRHAPIHDKWLETKVVCSKPCHGMNLLSTEMKDYLYNPCTGYRYVNRTRGPFSVIPWNIPGQCFTPEGHAFVVGNKIVGLGFNLLMQEHVIVEIFYHWKDFKSREYFLTCTISTCNFASLQTNNFPPLPVNDMPPTYLAGVLYWMSEPRLGQSCERAIVSFDIATNLFNVIPCPSCIATWNIRNHCQAFVVELQGMLCAVLANPVAETLDIWKHEHDRWDRAYTIYLKGWSGYSLGENVVVPWAVDPKDGRILLNTGRKVGLYDPERHFIESLYDLDEVLRVRSMEQSSGFGVYEGFDITKSKNSVNKCRTFKPPLEQHKFVNESSPALSANDFECSSGWQSLEEINSPYTKFMPLVPILYEENLASYPPMCKARSLIR